MPFLARCPYCKKRVQAPDRALGASAKCPGCGAWYTVAPDDSPDPEPGPQPDASATPSAPAEPVTPTPATAPAPVLAATAVAPVLVPPEPPAEREPGGLGALALGVLACVAALAVVVLANVQSATGLVRPLAAASLVFGVIATIASGGGRAAAVAGGGTGLSALALGAALFAPGLLGPTYEASRAKPDASSEALRAIPLQFGPEAGAPPDPTGYVDASRFALQQGSARVTLAEVAVGPVQVVDSKRRFTKEHHLALAVRVQHLGHGAPFRFTHWGTRTTAEVPPVTVTANGRRLAPANLGRDAALGVNYSAEVPPGQNAADVLLFEVPEPNVPLRVELPAEAWGGTGVFKFEVPVSMIARAAPPKPR